MVWRTGFLWDVGARVVGSSAPCDRIDDDVRVLRVQCLPLCEALLDKSDPISRQLLVSRAIEGIFLALAYGYRIGDRQTESHPVRIWRWLWLNAP